MFRVQDLWISESVLSPFSGDVLHLPRQAVRDHCHGVFQQRKRQCYKQARGQVASRLHHHLLPFVQHVAVRQRLEILVAVVLGKFQAHENLTRVPSQDIDRLPNVGSAGAGRISSNTVNDASLQPTQGPLSG